MYQNRYAEHLHLETEIKLPVGDPVQIRRKLARLGFRINSRRAFESNLVLDTPQRTLRRRGELIRIRTVGRLSLITYKGPVRRTRHKSREELETSAGDAATLLAIFERLGYEPLFRYEKYRTTFSKPGNHDGEITLDETPIGVFLELEGAPEWIDATARLLGFQTADYITASYGSLYLDYCKAKRLRFSHMTFAANARPSA